MSIKQIVLNPSKYDIILIIGLGISVLYLILTTPKINSIYKNGYIYDNFTYNGSYKINYVLNTTEGFCNINLYKNNSLIYQRNVFLVDKNTNNQTYKKIINSTAPFKECLISSGIK